jgi:flavorubredoxin
LVFVVVGDRLPTFFIVYARYLHEGIHKMTIRIAYYSWRGHTGKVATALAGLLNAELVRIEPSGKFHIAIGGMKALFSMRSAIKKSKTDLTGIDELIIATPVWSHKVPPFVNEYCSQVTSCEGKPFHVITEMGGSGSESAIAVVRKHLEKKGMRFVSSAATVERDVDSGAYIATVEKYAEGIRKK